MLNAEGAATNAWKPLVPGYGLLGFGISGLVHFIAVVLLATSPTAGGAFADGI
jgi:hypothetical protein